MNINEYLCSVITFVSIQSVPGGKVNILGGPSIGHSKKLLYMYEYMCPIPKGFRDRGVDVTAPIKERQDALRRVTRHGLTSCKVH
jgi:hypothetical protein